MNSDVFFVTHLLRNQLPGHLVTLFRACAERGIAIVIPQTVLLEFYRGQDDFVDKERGRIADACRLLELHGFEHSEYDPLQIVRRADVIEMIRALEVTVEVVEPTLDDFQGAHRRACNHEPPCPPKSKSDEMRDLIIWEIALGTARQEGAILVSRDEVHSHHRGDEEAEEAGLVRLLEVDAVLDFFELETPSGRMVRNALAQVWDYLAQRLPVLESASTVRAIKDSSFVQGEEGLERVRFLMTAPTQEGGSLSADVDILLTNGRIIEVRLTAIKEDEEERPDVHLVIAEERRIETEHVDYETLLESLREAMEDSNED